MILSIDPGVHHHGLALFHDGRLFRCGLVRGPAGRPALAEGADGLADAVEDWIDYESVLRVVAEIPQDRGKDRVPPDDLIALAFTLGHTTGRLNRIGLRLVRPVDWKGSTPKSKHQPRIIAALSADEAALIPSGALAHNVIDAVGIGLWAVGRISGGWKKGPFSIG